MATRGTPQPTVIRTERGLSIAGTRITLYSIMDYLHDGWPPHLICEEFNLTATQLSDVMEYIETHRDDVETEYQLVLQQSEEERRYWEAQNRKRVAKIATSPPLPGQEELRDKLQAAKAKLGML